MYLSACCTMCCTRGRRGSLRARAPGQLTLRHAFQRHISTQLSRAWGRREPLSQRWEDAHPDCSRGLVRLQLRLDTLVGAPLRPPYQWRRGSLRARAPGQHSGTPSRAISAHARFESCEACCEHAVTHGTLLGVRHHLRTSGVAFSFVLERLSNTPARLQEHAGFEPWVAVGKEPMGGCSLGAPTLLTEAAALA